VTDMRRGFVGLSGMVQTALKENPFSGHVFVFRGKCGDQASLAGWRRAMLVREGVGARTLYLTGSCERDDFADIRAAVDAAGTHRLAPACAQLCAADAGVSRFY
jgi:hypothetical protein